MFWTRDMGSPLSLSGSNHALHRDYYMMHEHAGSPYDKNQRDPNLPIQATCDCIKMTVEDITRHHSNATQENIVCQDASKSWFTIVKEELPSYLYAFPSNVFTFAIYSLLAVGFYAIAGRYTEDENESMRLLAAFALTEVFQCLYLLNNSITQATRTFGTLAFRTTRMTELWYSIQGSLFLHLFASPIQLTVVCLIPFILSFFGIDGGISKIVWGLAAINLAGLPFTLVVMTQKTILDCQHKKYPYMASSAVEFVVAFCVAIILTFLTPLGFYGLPIAVSFGKLIHSLLLFRSIRKDTVYKEYWPGWNYFEAWKFVPAITAFALRHFLESMSMVLSFVIIVLVTGYVENSTEKIAIIGIVIAIIKLLLIPLLGISSICRERIDKSLHAGHGRRGMVLSQIAVVASICVGCIYIALITYLSTTLVSAFTSSEILQSHVSDILLDFRPSGILLGIIAAFVGTVYGIGRQKCGSILMAVLVIGIGCLSGAYIVFKLEKVYIGFWAGLSIGAAGYVLIACVWLYVFADWASLVENLRVKTYLQTRDSC